MTNTLKDLRTGVIAFVLFSVLFGLAYPAAITGIAQLVFNRQANGSIIERDGEAVGSSLVGQSFSAPTYFHSRPSAAGADGYDASASSGSNLGPSSQVLADRIAEDAAAIREENGLAPDAELPVDAVTASSSGLDPHISPAYAMLQVPRIARERDVPEADVRRLVEKNRDDSTFFVLGEPRVNTLRLNLDLDKEFGKE
ncbi:MAG TPA: potassium-transporting ATPase subunit KdpC [Dehalococcoidia bacterium]